MRSLLTCLFLAVSLFLAPTPRAAAQAVPDTIEGTIRGQIDAFLAEDVTRAFTYASPTIRGIFGTPENFGAMVKQGYPMVWHPTSVRMLELREVSGNLWQRILVTDQAGASHMLDYQMIQTDQGWQINAVQLLPSVGVGA